MMRAVGLAVAVLLLTSCTDNGATDRPSGGSTRTPAASPTATLANPTRSPEREETTRTPEREETTRSPERGENTSPTETETEPETTATTRSQGPVAVPTPTEQETTRTETSEPPQETEPTRTESSEPTETSEPTQTTTTAAASPTTSPSVQPTSANTDDAGWWGWLLVAVLVALAVAIPLLVRSSHRREWREDLAADEDEVAWFARTLIPDLRGLGSLAGVAGGWSLAESRVAALEDRLTARAPSAPDEVARNRALDLRDAVRAARGQIQAMLQAGRPETMTQDLDAVAAQLEQVLAPPPPPPID